VFTSDRVRSIIPPTLKPSPQSSPKGEGERGKKPKGIVRNASTNGFTVESHFDNKDATVRKTYDGLLKSARKFGPRQ